MKASLSIDLDNKWSYMKTHGDERWKSLPSYLEMLVPLVLDILDDLHLRITFFIVGRDAASPRHADVLSEITRRGHEVGNHSYDHEPWMHRRAPAEINSELALAEDVIERATGQRPRGFRGPGFTRSDPILEILVRRGYLYDASSLPTFIGPLARAYYFRGAKLCKADRVKREELFGRFEDGLLPNKPHRIRLKNGSIAEIPVTTFPLLRVPIHLSYVLYAASAVSRYAASAYFRSALWWCRLTGTEPSILLHPLDFLSGEQCSELAFFPAMKMDPTLKRRIVIESLEALSRRFDVVPLREFAESTSGAA
ncbi:MAG TPA: polysaccharide deacetylase family protein [Candidatus Baltobacteraceae bacterium]|nr:polysaccharide deacetylase family protein [Candidatus Baltobacteraceae bacterium]